MGFPVISSLTIIFYFLFSVCVLDLDDQRSGSDSRTRGDFMM